MKLCGEATDKVRKEVASETGGLPRGAMWALRGNRKRSTEHLSHFCHRSQSYGIYAMRASAVSSAAGRVLIHSAGNRAASCSGGGLCISFSNTHSK